MYGLIGDIHGNADELEQLLEKLGYQKAQGIYRHHERRAIFLGDFINRGPKIRQVLEIVRPMIEEEHARAVMGNHESVGKAIACFCSAGHGAARQTVLKNMNSNT